VLRQIGFNFYSMSPEEAALSNSRVIITTKEEAKIIGKSDLLFDTDIHKYPSIFKARIIKKMGFDHEPNLLVIGIDPGNRIGIFAFYRGYEIESTVCNSIDSAINIVVNFLYSIESKSKLVRIGDGNPSVANIIVKELKQRFGGSTKIELVNEYGTSRHSVSKTSWRRDQDSAKKIALRVGRAI
jgi:hypothetical protein